METMLLPKDHFILQTDVGYILYIPLKGIIYLLNRDALEQLFHGLQEKEISPICSDELLKLIEIIKSEKISPHNEVTTFTSEDYFTWNYVTLDLSTNCTLSCGYCYSKCGEQEAVSMSMSCVEAALEHCISKIKSHTFDDNNSLYINFHGGSEPTVNWDLFTGVINYAKEKCSKNGINLKISMSTNGYYSEDKARWICSNLNSLSLSFDGYEEIQNFQRPIKKGGHRLIAYLGQQKYS